MNDILKLPKWAQSEIDARDREIKRLSEIIDGLNWAPKEKDFCVLLPASTINDKGAPLPAGSTIVAGTSDGEFHIERDDVDTLRLIFHRSKKSEMVIQSLMGNVFLLKRIGV
jgi:hypothetical protein